VEEIQLAAASRREEEPVGLENINVFAVTTADIPANSPMIQVPSFMILSSHCAAEELRSLDMQTAE
jgi:hypothetical protein